MRKLKIFLASLLVAVSGVAGAVIVSSLPYNLTNGTLADANQVMANFNAIVTSVNNNAANAGVNTNITALNGLTTPLSPASGGSGVYTGGVSGGSANAQTVASPTPSGYTVATGRRVTFTAGFTNTGATTLNVNGTGALNIYRQTVSGPAPLVGGEIVQNQVTDVWYDGTQYELMSNSGQGAVPTGTLLDFVGAGALPSGYLLADGNNYPRATFAALFNTLVATTTATTTLSSTSVVVPSSAAYQVGWYVGGTNVTCNTTITGKVDSTHITLSNQAGATGATTLNISPYLLGNCSTDFNVPNMTGRATAMVDGTTNLTSTTCTNAASLGTNCGTQTKTIAQVNLPAIAPTFSGTGVTLVLNSTGAFVKSPNGLSNNVPGGGSAQGLSIGASAEAVQVQGSYTPGGTISTLGSGTALSSVQPVALVYKVIKF